MRLYTGRLLVALFAATLVDGGLIACAEQATTAAILTVQQHGGSLGALTLRQLRSLPQIEIATPESRGAQVQKGPAVRSVLNAAGATGVSSVRVEGRDRAQTLTAAELTDQVILSFTKRNTLKLAGAQLDIDRWVRDVTTLVVNT